MLETFLREYLAPSNSIHCVAITPDAFDPAHAVSGAWFGNDWQSAAAWVQGENAKGRNVYWTVNLVPPGFSKNKPKKSDIVGIRCAHVDIDPPKDNPAWDKQAAFADLIARGAPSVVIDSGNGFQALWWLNEQTDVATIEQINRGIADRFDADHCWNVDRLLRLPGTVNHPDAKKRALGRVPATAGLSQPFNGAVYAPAALLAAFPASSAPETHIEELPDGPCEGYTGPENDDELIRLMLSSRGGMQAMFGNKASFSDLWHADKEALKKFFPSDSDEYGQSEADLALLAHLAFYTGRSAKRMDRLFRRSGLMRDKWNRASYRAITIGKALTGSTAFYNVVREPRAVATAATMPGLPGTGAPGLPGMGLPIGTQAVAAGGELLGAPQELLLISDQIEKFKGCVYVASLHQVLTPTGSLMKPEVFKTMYGGHTFVMSADMTGPTKNAFEAFTENRAYQFPKVETTMFEPQLPFGHIENRMVNVYMPDPIVRSEPGDVSPMLRHFEKLFPVERDREIIWTYLAAVVQNPGMKFQWAPFIQGAQGNGKSMIGTMLKMAVGPKYVHEPFSDDIANKFNDWLENRILIIVEELTLEGRYEVENNLKTWVTSDIVEMQAKGGKKSMRPNKSNWIILSNFKNSLPIDAGTRRYAPFFTAQQSAEDVHRDFPVGYFPELWDWLRNGGFAYMTHYLQTRELNPEFNPAGTGAARARAPETSSTNEAIGASMGNYEQEVLECVSEGREGFRSGWLSSVALTKLEEQKRLRTNRTRRKMALESLGFVEFGRSPILIMAEGAVRPTLWIQRNMRDKQLTVNDYLQAQGFAA
ncbi:DNA primase domain-containing protein [Rhizobium phage RHph_Y60]|nr:DNA primase domain-containing protein [Rhizobium phage RHph_Y60]